jgi:hypothetical protein
MYLRFQMSLLQLNVMHPEMKSIWKIEDMMTVFHNRFGVNVQPFYYPDFPDYVFKETVDPEMKELAKHCYHSEKKNAEAEENPNYKEINKKAAKAGFKTTQAMYQNILNSCEQRKAREERNKAENEAYRGAMDQKAGQKSLGRNNEETLRHKRKGNQNDDVHQPTTKQQKVNDKNKTSQSRKQNDEDSD